MVNRLINKNEGQSWSGGGRRGEEERDTVPLLAPLSFMWTPASPQIRAVEKISPGSH